MGGFIRLRATNVKVLCESPLFSDKETDGVRLFGPLSKGVNRVRTVFDPYFEIRFPDTFEVNLVRHRRLRCVLVLECTKG